jgi:hypothetical protein
METLLRKVGLLCFTALLAFEPEVTHPGVPLQDPITDISRLEAPDLPGPQSAWLDVKRLGAQGDGLADDTAAIQRAIDQAYARRGSVVFFPPGIYIISQIILRQGISLTGSGINPPPHGCGTVLQQKTGTDLDLTVSDETAQYQHWSVISNMRLVGAAGTKLSSGIRFAAATGEGMKFEHLLVGNFARDGIQTTAGVPFYAEDLHLFGNGIRSGVGYGLDIAAKRGGQTYMLCMISGDDNKTALIHIGAAGGIGNHQSFLIQGVKAEKHTKAMQNDVIVVDNMNGTPVTILGVAAANNSGEMANSVVKVVRSNARLFWFGLNRDNAFPNGYAYTVDDELNRRTFKDSAGSAGTYAGSYYFDALSTASPGSHFGQAEPNGDLAGELSIHGGTSASRTFSRPFSSSPVCLASPLSDPGKASWWVSASTTAVTVNLTAPARLEFAYHCFGNPN